MSQARIRVLALLIPLLTCQHGRGDDWPQWRGPNRDAVVPSAFLPRQWPETLKQQWKVEVGEGHSSPVAARGKVYVLSRQDENEVAWCLEPSTGKEIWRSAYPAPYEMNPAAQGHGKGPKSTPVVQGGRLYTLGISGILSCFDATTGKVNWRKEFSKQYSRTSPLYGTAMSPLVEQGLLILHAGGHDKGALTALDAATGEAKWTNDVDGPGYASPIAVTLAGERQIVTQTQNYLLGVAAATGTLLWKVPFKTEYDQNSITPLVYKDLLIYSGYAQPLRAIRIVKNGSTFAAETAWSNEAHPLYLSTPVLRDNLLVGMSYRKAGQVFGVDASNGKTLWQSEGRAGNNVAFLNAGAALLLLTDQGRLQVVKPSSSSYEPVRQYQVADSPTWAHPVLIGKNILIKDKTTLASWSLEG